MLSVIETKESFDFFHTPDGFQILRRTYADQIFRIPEGRRDRFRKIICDGKLGLIAEYTKRSCFPGLLGYIFRQAEALQFFLKMLCYLTVRRTMTIADKSIVAKLFTHYLLPQ